MAERDMPGSGRVVGGYVLERQIGAGGMGAIYRATAPDGRSVAVKILLDVGPTDESVRRRFLREAQIRIEHPNICRVLDAGMDRDGTPFIALELLAGETMDARLGRGPLPPDEVVGIGLQVCEGLAAAHAAGIVHRDLKPSNLFLCVDGVVKLFDFGIAFLWDAPGAAKLTQTGMVLGTPCYLSPEQARGQGGVDERTDVWALGVLLYEALSGRSPFERQTVLATVLAVLMDEPPALAASAPGVPVGLAAAVERAMRKTKEERWPDANAFAAALRATDVGSADTWSVPQSARVTIPAGEQRVVAILLAEDVRDFEAIRQAVSERGGDFIPLLGGRAIGLFGGAVWEGDEVASAAAAALRARPAAARMAVASGRASAGGSGISGDVLSAAEAGCAAGLAGVAIDAQSGRILGDRFSVREAPEGPWELVRAGISLRRSDAPEARPKPITFGRTRELEILRLAVDRVLREGRAVVVAVTGPPGIGKSHLRREFQGVLAAAAPGGRMLTGRAEPLRRQVAFGLFAAAMRDRVRLGTDLEGWPRLDPGASVEERRGAVRCLAREACGDAEPDPDWLAPLGELLGVPMADESRSSTVFADPQAAADRFRVAIHDLILALCRKGPLALVMEDLQWADAASLALLDMLVDELADFRLLAFVTARRDLDELAGAPFAGADVVRLRPQGLFPSEVAAMVESIAGRRLPEPLTCAIAERTSGNPLFVREILQALSDRDLLDGEVGSLPLPLTVEAAVQSRLDHLPPAEKDLCRRAAVYGRAFAAREVEALGVTGAEECLASATRRGLFGSRTRPQGEREFRFRSTLVADVAYRMLADDLRSELHRKAGALLGGRTGADPEEVAFHHERGGESGEAARFYATAALAAAGQGDSTRVVRCAEAARRLGMPPGSWFELHLAYADALGFLGRRGDLASALGAALEAASAGTQRARALARQADLLWRSGKVREGLHVAETAVDEARGVGDPEVLALVRGSQVAVLLSAGRTPDASEALQEALQLAGTSPWTRGFLEARRGLVAERLGDLSGQRDAFQAAVQSYRQAGDVRRAAGAESSLADACNRVGAYAEAVRALETALDGSRRVGNRPGESFALCNLGYSLAMLGRPDEALQALDQAERLASASRDLRLGTAISVYRARALLAASRPDDAVAAADEADRRAERSKAPGFRANAFALAAIATLASGDAVSALAYSKGAMSLRDEMRGIDEDEGEIFLAHARALAASGRPDEARMVLGLGVERIQFIAGRIKDPGWRARFLRDVPANRALLEMAGH